MAYPSEPVVFIPPGGANRGSRHADFAGPWKYNGKIYGCFTNLIYYEVPNPEDGIHMYVSSDDGNTWSIADEKASSFWTSLAGSVGGYSFARVGDVIYMAWMQTVNTSWQQYTLRISSFDLATETWTADASGAGPTVTLRLVRYSNNGTTRGRLHYILRAKSNGTMYLFYTGGYNGSSRTLPYYITWTPGGGWGSPASIYNDAARNHYVVNAINSGNRMHIFLCSDTDSFPTTTTDTYLHHVTLSESETLQTYQTVGTDISTNPSQHVGLPGAGTFGSETQLAIGALSGSLAAPNLSKHYVFTATEGDNPSWTTDTLDFPSGADWYYEDTTVNPQGSSIDACFYHGGKLYNLVATYKDDGDGYAEASTMWLYTKDGAAWSYESIFDLDDSYHWLLGSPQYGDLDDNTVGLFFFAQDWDSPNEYYDRTGNSGNAEREYFFVIEFGIVRGWAYFGAGMGATNTGNYGFFI